MSKLASSLVELVRFSVELYERLRFGLWMRESIATGEEQTARSLFGSFP